MRSVPECYENLIPIFPAGFEDGTGNGDTRSVHSASCLERARLMQPLEWKKTVYISSCFFKPGFGVEPVVPDAVEPRR